MLTIHEPKCENIDITNIKISPEPHIHWKKYFQKNPSFFRLYADFEADNEKNYSSSGNKTTTIFRRNPILNGYHVVSELEVF